MSSQADDPELAAKVAFGVYADQASLDQGWQEQIIFPLNVDVLEDPAFQDYEVPFFSGQQANKEVYVPAANAYKGMVVHAASAVLLLDPHRADPEHQRGIRYGL